MSKLFHVHPDGHECEPDDRGIWWREGLPATECNDLNNSGCMDRSTMLASRNIAAYIQEMDRSMREFTIAHDSAERIDWTNERADVLGRFNDELAKATGDGSKKRQAGTKPPWHEDNSHEAAMFSHLMKWKRGELVDPDSGAHPLVHLAWRALAIACKESGNKPGASSEGK